MINPSISIIIPVYNVEKYIRRCIDSIIAQTFENWELILVDDGTHDNSGAICDEYSKLDPRIKVYHKENGGVSVARNYALDRAKGDYVIFVDSDDYIDAGCVETLMHEAIHNNLDLLQFGIRRISEAGNVLSISELGTPVVCKEDYFKLGRYNVCVAGSLYRRCLIQKYNIRFMEGLKHGEDQLFYFSFLDKALRIRSIPQVFYNYLLNYSSATSKAKSKDQINSIMILSSAFENHSIFKNHFYSVINKTLKYILVNFDLSVSEYICLYNRYYHPNCNEDLQSFHIVFTKMPRFAYYVFGSYLHYKTKIRSILGELYHKFK